MSNKHILIIDDDYYFRLELTEFLTSMGFDVSEAENAKQGKELIQQNQYHLVFIDIVMPGPSGLHLLKELMELYPNLPVIMVSGFQELDLVLKAMRLGAIDFLSKPIQLDELRHTLDRIETFLQLKSQLKSVTSDQKNITKKLDQYAFGEIISCSTEMNNVLNMISRVAPLEYTDILITGESGVGKELVARAIHNLSNRRKNSFYDINCSAVPESLFESELFGHTKQAFTGANSEKPGAFEMANGGDLFLDEIASLPLSMQSKLLRVLDERTIRRIGAIKTTRVDVRVIAASNLDLRKHVEEGNFRNDLYHRLNSFEIYIPPLRERKDDIRILVEHFVHKFAELMQRSEAMPDDASWDLLQKYTYPGNVRELKNLIRKALILSDPETSKLTTKDFPDILHQQTAPMDFQFSRADFQKLSVLEDTEKKWIINALNQFHFNKSRVAKALGISRTSLIRRLAKYNIESPGDDE